MYGIKEEDNKYIVQDETNGGFTTRTGMFWHRFKSVWNNNIELIEFYYLDEDSMEIINDKKHDDNRRCILAKNRHLKMLKKHLGIEVEKPKEKEKTEIIWTSGYYDTYGKLNINTGILTNKTFNDKRLSYLKHTIVTPEKIKLAKEYMNKYKEFEEYKKEVFDKLFEK